MSTPVRMAGFAVGLVAVLAASLGLGRLTGPVERPSAPAAHDMGEEAAGHGDDHADAAAHGPAGLQVSEDGYRLVPETTMLTAGVTQEFRFRVLGPDGATVGDAADYATEHEKKLHLIVVRRDLVDFRHVHPSLGPDGAWSVPLTVAAAGQYRVFADFRPAGHDRGLTLGVDVPVPGEYRPGSPPPVDDTATVDGYTVTVAGTLTPGASSALTLTVTRDGTPVTDLEPYLGAYGHLVALRDGDLAYLHVHPEGTPGDGVTPSGPSVTFVAEVPTAGVYRLYLDFRHGGVVRTVAFTAVAGGAEVPAAPGHDHGSGDHEHGHG
jgi:hypothetical protein